MVSYKNELYLSGYLEYNGQGNHILRLTNLNATSNDFAASKLILSPNPTTNTLNISIEGAENYKENQKSIKIFDLQGKKVYETTFLGEKTELALENLINGMYILQINSASQSTVGKFIINK